MSRKGEDFEEGKEARKNLALRDVWSVLRAMYFSKVVFLDLEIMGQKLVQAWIKDFIKTLKSLDYCFVKFKPVN